MLHRIEMLEQMEVEQTHIEESCKANMEKPPKGNPNKNLPWRSIADRTVKRTMENQRDALVAPRDLIKEEAAHAVTVENKALNCEAFATGETWRTPAVGEDTVWKSRLWNSLKGSLGRGPPKEGTRGVVHMKICLGESNKRLQILLSGESDGKSMKGHQWWVPEDGGEK
eukprot:Gb_09789 [translate_table: standard]